MMFFIPIDPPRATDQEKKIAISKTGRPVFYRPSRLKKARTLLEMELKKHAPKALIEGPLRLIVCWIFRTKNKRLQGTWKETRPDTDNLEKMLKDVMTHTGYWKDDAQVCMEVVLKAWGADPGILIGIDRLCDAKEEMDKIIRQNEKEE